VDDLLLHACCGPCSTVAVPAWRAEGLEPVLRFFNPNVQPWWEYEKRLQSLRVFANAAGCRLMVARAAGVSGAAASWAAPWLAVTAAGDAPQPERCAGCVAVRLREAARAARAGGFARFATTLTVSPYQDHALIRRAGEEAGEAEGIEYLHRDLRSHFKLSYAESRRLGLYRQSYCGCVPSKWEARLERLARRRGAAGGVAAEARE
jgi:epoxyqueuosine reductase